MHGLTNNSYLLYQEQVATCVPCPTGGSECGAGEACWKDMEWACQGNVVTTTETQVTVTETTVDVSVEFEDTVKEEPVEEQDITIEPEPKPLSEKVDVTVEFQEPKEDQAAEQEPVPAPRPVPASKPAPAEPVVSEPAFDEAAVSEPAPAETPAAEPAAPEPESASASESAAVSEPVSVSVPAAVSEPESASASEPAAVSEPAVSEPASELAVTSEPAPLDPAATAAAAVSTSISNQPMKKVENLRMALYGMQQLTSKHVNAWEEHTGKFVEEFYNTGATNNAIRDSVNNVVSSFEGVEFGMSSGRRNLRVQRSQASAFLITYHQKIQFESSSDVQLGEIVQHPFSTSTFREEYVSYLKLKEPILFAELAEVSAVFLPAEMSNPTVTAEAGVMVSPTTTDNVVDSGKFKDFKCHTSGIPCESGKCADGDHCMFFPMSSTDIEPYSSLVQLPTENSASSLLSAFLNGEISAVATDSASSSVGAAFGPSDVNGKMLLSGVNLVNSEHLMEWSHQTAVYVQDFFNNESNSPDYVQNKVYNVHAMFEILSVDYGTMADPSTHITFVQTTEWGSHDESIDKMTVVNQPFMTEAYRQAYVEHLQNYLPGTFKLVTDVPSITADAGSAATSEYKLSDTFFCGIQYPVDCSNTKRCDNADDCPAGYGCFVAKQCLAAASEPVAEQAVSTAVIFEPISEQTVSTAVISGSSLPCNLCKPGQIGIDAEIIFNEKQTRCAEAYDHMVVNYKEGSSTCSAAQDALSSTCCRDPPSSEPEPVVVAVVASESIADTATVIETTTVTTTETILHAVEMEESELLYPSNTYFCGTSFQDASTSCSKACPSGKDNECLGLGETCHGNTQCDLRGSFFCGSSWFDASEKCSQPCPDGDASVCGEGEKCFAWTSCSNTDSFYCGYSFDNANRECKIPCTSRSSLECPDDMGCWAYTTCDAQKEGPHESGPEPMNDFFCGDTKEAASSTCSIACQSGSDDECPGDLKCFDSVGCSDREQFWCGSDWLSASQTCGQPCSSGSSDECGEGESCYAHTECQSDLFFCGDTFEHASETCGRACPSRSSNECDYGQSCYAFVTACANTDAAQSIVETYTFMASNNVWGPDLDMDILAEDNSEQELPKPEELPDWYLTWEQDQMNASSTSTWLSIVYLALASLTIFITF